MSVLGTGKNQHQCDVHLLCANPQHLHKTPLAISLATAVHNSTFQPLLEVANQPNCRWTCQPALVALLISRPSARRKVRFHQRIIPTLNNQASVVHLYPATPTPNDSKVTISISNRKDS